MNNCDKCGREVALSNDALSFSIARGDVSPFAEISHSRRHLFPVEGCYGSPSRVALIVAGEENAVRALNEIKGLGEVSPEDQS
jgi:hypothetical protein